MEDKSNKQILAESTPSSTPPVEKPQNNNNCLIKGCIKIGSASSWVLKDFAQRHLIWIKLIFFFQSASMTVLYPYLNLQMKSLGLGVHEAGVINAVIPVLFVFTPPLAGFLNKRVGNFRVLLSILTAIGGCVSLLLLLIPVGRDITAFPDYMEWGLSCGHPNNRARFQKLVLKGFQRDACDLNKISSNPSDQLIINNISFTPGTCGYLCPTRANLRVKPRFNEYKVIWPNRGGGFGISEIVDVVTLDSPGTNRHNEPQIIDNNIFFPMNWSFRLNCDRIRPNDCVFNPGPKPVDGSYSVTLRPSEDSRSSTSLKFVIPSIWPPFARRPVTSAINCGAKEVLAQVITTVETNALPGTFKSAPPPPKLVDTRFSGCNLHCLVKIPRTQLCSNSNKNIIKDPSLTFWSYLFIRTILGVLTASSLMMFEGAVMSTVQELGGDYGIQRLVGNLGAIIFAPLGGYLCDSSHSFKSIIFVYLILKLLASLLILFVKLDFKPSDDKTFSNLPSILKDLKVVVFLFMMLSAGVFWGYIESFLFWFLDDLGAKKLLMGCTVAVGMATSLPFLLFSGPITDLIGHMNVIILGMVAYTVRLIGYSFLANPLFVFPYEALEGFTMALMMTSSVTYVAKIGKPETIGSIMSLMGALFFGIGKGSGSLLGGILTHFFGARITFRYLSGNALICGFVYLIYQLSLLGKSSEAQNSPSKEESVGETNEAYENVEQDHEKSMESLNKMMGGVVNGLQLNTSSTALSLSGPRSLTEGTRV